MQSGDQGRIVGVARGTVPTHGVVSEVGHIKVSAADGNAVGLIEAGDEGGIKKQVKKLKTNGAQRPPLQMRRCQLIQGNVLRMTELLT
jgi:hypothetical protein